MTSAPPSTPLSVPPARSTGVGGSVSTVWWSPERGPGPAGAWSYRRPAHPDPPGAWRGTTRRDPRREARRAAWQAALQAAPPGSPFRLSTTSLVVAGPPPARWTPTPSGELLGPGWAHLALRVERRLRRAGVPWRVLADGALLGADGVQFVLPPRAPLRVVRRYAAAAVVARTRCELCLRRVAPAGAPAGTLAGAPAGGAGVPADDGAAHAWGMAPRLCALHAPLCAPVGARLLRAEAWAVVGRGTGLLRWLLLGGGLTAAGWRAALAATVDEPVLDYEEGDWIGWLPRRWLLHALERAPAAVLAVLAPPDIAPLLASADEAVRETALLLLTRIGAAGVLPVVAHHEAR